ncbi:GAF domain-containing protein [Effusibacillus consociatus]|uniref:GAF domain-containing protein n=1 Tax=Effusibacillus consociatus TaxID=1117041 RepID=A0ABV9Q347_9BACL
MGSLQGDIETSLSELRRLTDTDFAALAWSGDNDRAIRWKYASGNRNDRYKRIGLQVGKGVAGKVMRSGRPMVVESFSPQKGDDPREYPILLAENLKSIISVPVIIENRIRGVLLVGCRHPRTFTAELVELVSSVAEQLGTMCQQRGGSQHESVRPFTIHRDMGGNKSM